MNNRRGTNLKLAAAIVREMDPPCNRFGGCTYLEACRDRRLACGDFYAYVSRGGRLPTRILTELAKRNKRNGTNDNYRRIPTRIIFDAIYKEKDDDVEINGSTSQKRSTLAAIA